jgi:hypothetical protein
MGERGHAHRGQPDENQQGIVMALVAMGCSVEIISDPTDLLVGFRGINLLLEVKLPRRAKGGTSHSRLNPKQKRFFGLWRGQRAVVRNPLEACQYVNDYVKAVMAGQPNSIEHPTN